MKLRLTLDYRLGGGRLTPFLEGLTRGQACAACCTNCGRVTFPPERVCACQMKQRQTQQPKWLSLTGQGQIVFRTTSSVDAFALVHFDGADNRAVCRLDNPGSTGVCASLLAGGEDLPGMAITVLEESQ